MLPADVPHTRDQHGMVAKWALHCSIENHKLYLQGLSQVAGVSAMQ